MTRIHHVRPGKPTALEEGFPVRLTHRQAILAADLEQQIFIARRNWTRPFYRRSWLLNMGYFPTNAAERVPFT